MVRVRHPLRYQLICTGLILLGNVVLSGLLHWTVVSIVYTMLIYFFSLFFDSEESTARKLMAAGFMVVLLYVTDGIGSAIYVRIGGQIYGEGHISVTETPEAYLLINVIAVSIYLMLQQVLFYFWNRFANHAQTRFLWYFALFPLSQAMLFILADHFAATSSSGQKTAFLLLSIVSLLCIGADIVLFRTIGQLMSRENAEQRTAFL